MPRGGPRQGTPGKGYSNRVDLATNYDNAGSAAAGGMEPAAPTAPTRSPDDSPMLLDPTANPQQPLTAGLSSGPGGGPELLGLDPRVMETQKMKKWLPILKPVMNDPETPDSVKMLYRYIRSS